MSIKIENLNKHPEYIKVVTDWIYSEWGNNNYNYWKEWINNSLNDKVPMTFIVLVDNIPAGTFSLWTCDIQSRQDLTPWFGGLYVVQEYRGKLYNNEKLGSLMQKHAIKVLKELKYETAYLFTKKNWLLY